MKISERIKPFDLNAFRSSVLLEKPHVSSPFLNSSITLINLAWKDKWWKVLMGMYSSSSSSSASSGGYSRILGYKFRFKYLVSRADASEFLFCAHINKISICWVRSREFELYSISDNTHTHTQSSCFPEMHEYIPVSGLIKHLKWDFPLYLREWFEGVAYNPLKLVCESTGVIIVINHPCLKCGNTLE